MKINKFIAVLFGCLLLLSGCSSKELVKPISTETFMDTLDESVSNQLIELNGGYNLNESIFEVVGEKLPNIELSDINNESLNLTDLKGQKVILEVVSPSCSYCQLQSREYTDAILEEYEDVIFIQYFVEGNTSDIMDFYEVIETEINDKLLIVLPNSEFTNWLLEVAKIEGFPTFLMIDENSEIGWVNLGVLDTEGVERVYDVSFNRNPDIKNIKNSKGETYHQTVRTYEDVKNDVKKDNQEKLKSLDVDGYLEYSTYENLGKEISFTNSVLVSDITNTEIDFSALNTGKVLINFLFEYGNIDNSDNIAFLNKFVESNSDIKVLNILVTYDANTVERYEALSEKPTGHVVSNMDLPEDIYSITLFNSPSLVFINDGIIYGVASGPYSTESLNQYNDLFFVNPMIVK